MKKILTILCLMAILFTSASITAFASGGEILPDNIVTEEMGEGDPDAEIQADQLEWKYRVYNGVLQRRRWNITKNCWYDPIWYDVETS